MISELVRPARDPRPEFVTAALKEGVEKISDLAPGMILEGTVSNVAAFGAFVDVGVHQDGLVHVSAMSSKFISDPREVVTSGQVVKVKVLEVDPGRKRISLTLRLDDDLPAAGESKTGGSRGPRGAEHPRSGAPAAAKEARVPAPGSSAMADALRRAGLGK
ncbi:hypothetical protein GCM10023166_15090 [Paeniglutamicibacter cryotolerans]|uniref:Transcriptional accessory protein Tex/SPT6 n=1 Tax=Paeniglutamicibacter cryotolerans TaxID=670079 RepID=A0A839QFK4_9MICC|nr:transcriptional accessory protein Tex/SPT6 [Paeniglutamicibacter cryotolerans]